jgi:hypothetical protein
MMRPAGLALAVLLATLGGLVAWELAGAARDTGPLLVMGPPPALGPLRTAARTGTSRAPEWVKTILARPLFSPSRRPPAVASAGALGPARLAGIVVSASSRQAIFAPAGDGKPIAITEGGRVGAYVVTSIKPDQVVVVGPDGEHRLHPAFDASDHVANAAGAGPRSEGKLSVPTFAEPPNPLAVLRLGSQRWRTQ